MITTLFNFNVRYLTVNTREAGKAGTLNLDLSDVDNSCY